MKHQRLVVESIARAVLVSVFPKIHMAILSNEIVVTQAEQIVFGAFTRLLSRVYWDQSKALPLFIE